MSHFKSHFWVFTLNNPLHAGLELPPGASYLVWQVEKGKEGTPHLQGYVEWDVEKTLAGVRKWLPNAHWEKRMGTAVQARDYCMKEESRVSGPWELGKMVTSEQGKRNDLKEFMEDAIRLTRKAMLSKWPKEMARFWRVYEGVLDTHTPGPVGKREVVLCYGSAGTGKTLYARSLCPEEESCVVPVSKDMWFNGVMNARVVVLDDFTGAYKLSDLLRLLHEYPERVAIKGGFTWWNPEVVVVTTNIDPMRWYDWAGREEQREALGRRFTQLLFFGDEKRDVTTLPVVPGCKVNWICMPGAAPGGAKAPVAKKRSALDALMNEAKKKYIEAKKKRDELGMPQNPLARTQAIKIVEVGEDDPLLVEDDVVVVEDE